MLADSSIVQQLLAQGAEPLTSTPAELAKYMRADHERWKKVIRSAGFKAE